LVIPIGKVDGALLETEATVQLSAVVGFPNTTPVAVHVVFAFIVRLTGAVIVGFVLSNTVTVWVAVAVFPDASVTIHTTEVKPIGKVVGALFETEATEQLSAVTGVPRLTEPIVQEDPAKTLMFVGGIIIGATFSIT
jgi:hypothetical protein